MVNQVNYGNIHLFCGDSLDLYDLWKSPTVIISDGPYGVNGFPGDLKTYHGLAEWYEPHIKKWSKNVTPITTLWFWNTEVGWATVHPALEANGWDYVSCCVWDKGMSHVAGNINTKTIRHLPVVTEVCVQYVRRPEFYVGNKVLTMKDWLYHEWQRTGLPFSKTNDACGVKNAATRKYFTKDHLWYMPPADVFEKLANYANKYGKDGAKPYFSINGKNPISKEEWERMRSKFYCPVGFTNVWTTPQLRGKERLKDEQKAIHMNQKPIELIKKIIEVASDPGDVVWDPFGGLFTTAVSAAELDRECFCAEIAPIIFKKGQERVLKALQEGFKGTIQF